MLRLFLASLLVALSLCAFGCPGSPTCTPHSQACVNDVTRTCSSTGYGYAAGGLPLVPCSAVGGRCVVEGGRARCAALPRDADAADASEGGAP